MEEGDWLCIPGALPLGIHWVGVLSGSIAGLDRAWKREITCFPRIESLLPGCPVVNQKFSQQCLGCSPCHGGTVSATVFWQEMV
jgi:hypothetical protein